GTEGTMAKDSGPKGQQPEALRSLKSAARSGSRKPAGQGYEARGDTAPKPAAPERKQKAAAEILDAGADKRLDKMRKAAKKAPPR
ncbi:MAG: hypothetical protein ACJ8BE_18345, partial [Microvirga sp.]